MSRKSEAYRNAIMNPTNQQIFERKLKAGKRAEAEVAYELRSLGFKVRDISNRQGLDGRYIPFDLVAIRGSSRYIIDVKLQSMNKCYWIMVDVTQRYQAANTKATKLVVFRMSGKPTRYILANAISSCELNKSGIAYTIRFPETTNIELLV